MAEELLPADVELYTKGRLSRTDPGVERALASAKARVRRFCGWHVSPVATQTISLDGNGDIYLFLPTLKVVNLTAITEDGVALDVAEIERSVECPGMLIKKSRGHWARGYGNIEVTFEHGFTADEAQDWREAVLSLIDQASLTVGTGRNGPVISKRVDDVQMSWSGLPNEVENAPLDRKALSTYRLLAI